MLEPWIHKKVHQCVTRVVDEIVSRSAHADLVLEVLSAGHVTEVGESATIVAVVSLLPCSLSHLIPVVEDSESLISPETVCQR